MRSTPPTLLATAGSVCRHFLQSFFLLLFLVIVTCRCTGQDSAAGGFGAIHGRILTPAEEVMDELIRGKKLLRYGGHNHAAEPVQPYRLSEIAVVYIENINQKRSSPPSAEHPQLNQSQMVFRPLVLPIQVGTTVDFPNSDKLFHNVFSYSQPKEFDLGRYSQGEKKSVRFDTPGIVNVYCDIHSYMYATIIVFGHSFFTVPDDDGNFLLKDIPEGQYDLSFWYGRKKVDTHKVTVKSGETATINFP